MLNKENGYMSFSSSYIELHFNQKTYGSGFHLLWYTPELGVVSAQLTMQTWKNITSKFMYASYV